MRKTFYFLGTITLLTLSYRISMEEYRSKDPFVIPATEKSRLSIHVFSSPFGVNWESPQTLLYSNLVNFASPFNRKMGHVAAEIQCVNSDKQTTYYNFTGMIDQGKDIYDKMFVRELGFGVMFADFPGALETRANLQKELEAKRKTGRVHTVTYQITEANCKNLENYLKEYKREGVDQIYGGLNYEVRQKRRAGCVHFAYSLVDIANLEDDPFMKYWERDILIPKSLIGGDVTQQKVSVLDMLSSHDFQKWAKENEPHHKITFWDIDAIFDRLEGIVEGSNFTVLKREKSKEFIIDRTDITDFETNYWLN